MWLCLIKTMAKQFFTTGYRVHAHLTQVIICIKCTMQNMFSKSIINNTDTLAHTKERTECFKLVILLLVKLFFYKGSNLESCLVFATKNLSFFCEVGPRSFCDSFRPFVSFDYVSYQSYLALLMTKGVQHSHWEFCSVITPNLKFHVVHFY